MKIWAILGIFLITAIGTFVPCCPGEECGIEACIAFNNETEIPEEGPCSPFFACAGCTGFVSITKTIVLMTPSPLQRVYNGYHSITDLPYYSTLCWQPPRTLLI